MDFIYILISFNVSIIFLFNRNILFVQKNFWLLFILNILLFIIGYFKNINWFLIPITSQLIFLLLSKIYFNILRDNPKDTFWTLNNKLINDSIFNIVFWILSILIYLIFI